MIVLSGCSALEDTGGGQTPSATGTPVETVTSTQTDTGMENGSETETQAQFDASVRYPTGGVAGNESVVEIDVENTGEARGQYNATLTADGEQVATESVTLDSGVSTTVSLTHTFEEPGEHTLSVADRNATITVYETPRAFIDAQEDTVETVSYQEDTSFDGTVQSSGRTVETETESAVTVSKNLTAETMYETGTATTTARGETSTDSVQTWIVDGVEYSKSVGDNGETTYDRELSDEFDEGDAEMGNASLQPYLRTAHTDDEYVFIIEANTSAEATELWRTLTSLQDENIEIVTSSEMDALRFEYRYDRQTGHQTREVADVESSGGETFVELDMTITKSSYSYGEQVTVEVPQDVKDGTSDSGTTGGSGTYAALAAGH